MDEPQVRWCIPVSSHDLTYQEAFAELQAIVRELEEGCVDIDALIAKVQRASFLYRFLRQRLRSTEEEIESILKEGHDAIPPQ